MLEKYSLKKQGPIFSNLFLYITRGKKIFPKQIKGNTSDSENNSVGRTGNARLSTPPPASEDGGMAAVVRVGAVIAKLIGRRVFSQSARRGR